MLFYSLAAAVVLLATCATTSELTKSCGDPHGLDKRNKLLTERYVDHVLLQTDLPSHKRTKKTAQHGSPVASTQLAVMGNARPYFCPPPTQAKPALEINDVLLATMAFALLGMKAGTQQKRQQLQLQVGPALGS